MLPPRAESNLTKIAHNNDDIKKRLHLNFISSKKHSKGLLSLFTICCADNSNPSGPAGRHKSDTYRLFSSYELAHYLHTNR